MRTFEEIKVRVDDAMRINNAEALLLEASELDNLSTLDAEALAMRARGLVHDLRGDYPAALQHYQRALGLYEELADRSGVANAHVDIGNVHSTLGNSSTALEHYQRAQDIYGDLDDRSGMARVTGNLGNLCYSTSNYPEALEHFHQALAIFEELGNSNGVAAVTSNIGIVYGSTGDDLVALEYYRNALAAYEDLGDRSAIARIIGSIGATFFRTGDYSAALEQMHRALALHNELGERSGVASVTGNILSTYVISGNDAEAHATLMIIDAMNVDEPGVRVQCELQRAILQQRSGDLDAAATTLKRALSEALRHGLRMNAADAHMHLRDLALLKNDLAGYVEHNNEYTRINEEINGKDTATKLAMQAKQREIDTERKEHEKHMAVLHSTLPKHIADRVARGEVVNDSFDNAAVLFLDVVGFTTHSSELPASVVVQLLQNIFTAFDGICTEHNVMKIKTIGDSYMAVAFPSEHHLNDLAAVALAMQACTFTWPHTGERVMFRIGLHCGPVVAGVLGTERMQYDVWGDTVNVASRMESTGEAGRVHVSEAFAEKLEDSVVARNSSLVTIDRGSIDIKGKGMMNTYWLESTR